MAHIGFSTHLGLVDPNLPKGFPIVESLDRFFITYGSFDIMCVNSQVDKCIIVVDVLTNQVIRTSFVNRLVSHIEAGVVNINDEEWIVLWGDGADPGYCYAGFFAIFHPSSRVWMDLSSYRMVERVWTPIFHQENPTTVRIQIPLWLSADNQVDGTDEGLYMANAIFTLDDRRRLNVDGKWQEIEYDDDELKIYSTNEWTDTPLVKKLASYDTNRFVDPNGPYRSLSVKQFNMAYSNSVSRVMCSYWESRNALTIFRADGQIEHWDLVPERFSRTKGLAAPAIGVTAPKIGHYSSGDTGICSVGWVAGMGGMTVVKQVGNGGWGERFPTRLDMIQAFGSSSACLAKRCVGRKHKDQSKLIFLLGNDDALQLTGKSVVTKVVIRLKEPIWLGRKCFNSKYPFHLGLVRSNGPDTFVCHRVDFADIIRQQASSTAIALPPGPKSAAKCSKSEHASFSADEPLALGIHEGILTYGPDGSSDSNSASKSWRLEDARYHGGYIRLVDAEWINGLPGVIVALSSLYAYHILDVASKNAVKVLRTSVVPREIPPHLPFFAQPCQFGRLDLTGQKSSLARVNTATIHLRRESNLPECIKASMTMAMLIMKKQMKASKDVATVILEYALEVWFEK